MDIYVAGKTHDYPRVREVQRELKKLGHYITYDWTRDVERCGPDYEVSEPSEADKAIYAKLDVKGVKDADLLIVLGHPNLCGTLVEVGVAIANDTPVILVDVEQYSVFWHLPNVMQWSYDHLMSLLGMGNLIREGK